MNTQGIFNNFVQDNLFCNGSFALEGSSNDPFMAIIARRLHNTRQLPQTTNGKKKPCSSYKTLPCKAITLNNIKIIFSYNSYDKRTQHQARPKHGLHDRQHRRLESHRRILMIIQYEIFHLFRSLFEHFTYLIDKRINGREVGRFTDGTSNSCCEAHPEKCRPIF